MDASALHIHSLSQAPWYLHAHLALALMALLIGGVVLIRRKGTTSHKVMGWCWVLLMLSAALISFFIQARGHLSFIHVLSVVVLVSIPRAILNIRRGDRRGHAIGMVATFAGLAIAGLFTLLPYRMLGTLVFGSSGP